MVVTQFRGKDFITTQEWSEEELETVFEVALDLKRKFAMGEPHEYLRGKTLFMIFYNPSLRTRNSFEAGMTQLGGHAHYLAPEKIYTPTLGPEETKSGKLIEETRERISDTARVLSRYGHAISIRIFGEPTKWVYGFGNRVIREFAYWADIPVINMECDMYHPCQAMADVLTLKEKLGKLEGKKFVMSWAYSPSPWKPVSVPQSLVLLPTRYGMDVVLAHPEGLELDPKIIELAKKNAEESGGSFEISYDMNEAFEGADVVYPKSWTSIKFLPPQTEKPNFDAIKEIFEKNRDWICTQEKLDLCNKHVLYMHCLPADRGYEVTDEVIDGPHSVVFDEAENRLHVQKAIMLLVMGGRP